MPKLTDEAFKELLALYVRAHRTPGISLDEGKRLRAELNQKLRDMYADDPLPFPFTFDDFRHSITDRFNEILKKDDPRFRRDLF